MSETRSHTKGGLLGTLIIPIWDGTRTRQIKIACCGEIPVGEKGILRIKRKSEKWVADATTTLPDVQPLPREIVMGVDTGIKVPAVAYIAGQSASIATKQMIAPMNVVSVDGLAIETLWEQSTSVAGLALMVIVKVPREPLSCSTRGRPPGMASSGKR